MKKRETAKKIREEISKTTIPEELKVLYLMAAATELINQNAFERIKAVFLSHGLTPKENELLTGITDYCKHVKLASFLFESRIEDQIIGATFGASDSQEGEEERARRYDQFTNDAGVICRLVMLFVDRASLSEEAYRRVFKLLRQLPSMGYFKDEDFTRFKTRLEL